MIYKLYTVLVFLISYFWIEQVFAYEQNSASSQSNSDVERITVTATRSKREIDQSSKSVSVITRDQIQQLNPRNTLEVLEQIPGVFISRAGGLNGQIVMRGSNSNDPRMVLFIDGDRFRGRNTLEYMLIDPSQIERIELVRGPISALYGPDAMAGIVNIITRRASGINEDTFRLNARLASLSANSINNQISGRAELEGLGRGFDMLLGISGRQADDYRSPQGRIPNSDFNTWAGDLRLGYSPSDTQRFELILKQAEVRTGRAGGIGGAPGAPFLTLRENPLREQYAKIGFSHEEPGAGLSLLETSLYIRKLYTHIEVENRTTANRLVEADNWVDGPVITGGKIVGVRPWVSNSLTLGADFFHENRKGTQQASTTTEFDSQGNVTSVNHAPRRQSAPDATQTDIGIFIHNDWDPVPEWTISTGARVDHIQTESKTSPVPHPSLQAAYDASNKSLETPVTGSLGIIYRPWQVLHFTGNIGKAFRAPATFESFGSNRQGAGFLVPNPDLRSEEALVYELGTRLRFNQFQANLTAFYNDYSNLIVTRPIEFDGTNSTQRQNVGKATMVGAEWDSVWNLGARWRLVTNAAYLQGTDEERDQPLAYIPPLSGLIGIRYIAPEGYYLELQEKLAMRKTRIDESVERETAAFAVLNLHAGIDLWRFASWMPGMRLTVGVENALNATYRQTSSVENINFERSRTNPLHEPGRSFSIGISSI